MGQTKQEDLLESFINGNRSWFYAEVKNLSRAQRAEFLESTVLPYNQELFNEIAIKIISGDL